MLTVADFTELVGYADIATGKLVTNSNSQDAIVVGGQLADGRVFVFDEWVQRAPTEVLTENIFAYNNRWRCSRFGMDATGTQRLYFDMVVKEAVTRKERISLIPREFTVSEGSKEFRLTTIVQRFMHNGLLFIDRKCTTLIRQLTKYPTGTHTDAVDALAGLLSLLRDPMASRARLQYDPDYDETLRWRKAIRDDNRYAPFAKR